MGARGSGGGVEPLKESIRLRFSWSGKRCYETLDIPPTAPNLKAAQRLMDTINAEIRSGVFVYARHFPDSAAAKEPTTLTTFKDYAERWLETLTCGHATKKDYTAAIRQVWIPALGTKALKDIRYSDLKVVVAARAAAVSGKTVNNNLIPLRGVLDTAVADMILTASPANLIQNLSHQSPGPDPFTPDEMEAILAYFRDHAPVAVWAYFETAFLAGLRPSEQIIIPWGNVDWGARSLRVDGARTRGQDHGTKTWTVRDVDLSPRAVAAISRMKPSTFMRGADEPIFANPATGLAWNNEQYQRTTWFHPALKKLGIRSRDAYQTRHTYATTALMGGVAPAYIARQMGHKNAAMLFQKYGKWIDRADGGREAAKLAALHSGPVGHALATTP